MRIIAEIGSSWRLSDVKKSRALALRLIEEAAEVGATDVKFQVWKADTFYSRERAPDAYEKVKRYELPIEWLDELRTRADDCKVGLWASVFDVKLVPQVSQYLTGIKVASGDMTYEPIVRACAEAAQYWRIPIAVSTGASTHDEVLETLEWLSDYRVHTILMHCISQYPASMMDANLLAGKVFEDAVDEIGFSDHIASTLPAQIAVGMGYTTFEKHFQAEEFNVRSPDVNVAFTPYEFREYVYDLWVAHTITGKRERQPLPCEMSERVGARRGSDGLRPTI